MAASLARSAATASPRVSSILIGTLVMALLLAIAPLADLYPIILEKAMCFAIFACAFNLLLGFGGLLSFGHAMFLGTAGYVTAYAAKTWGLSPELAILTGTLASGFLGAVVGLVTIRRQGIYFAMITLAIAQMMFFFYVQAPFTHGEDGIQAVPRGHLFGFIDLANPLAMYYTVLVIFIATFLLIYRIVHSPFGQVLKAILGGMGTLFGPVVGAFALVAIENYLAALFGCSSTTEASLSTAGALS